MSRVRHLGRDTRKAKPLACSLALNTLNRFFFQTKGKTPAFAFQDSAGAPEAAAVQASFRNRNSH